MNEPRQKLMEALGQGGCYVLSIVHLAEQLTNERIDAIPVFLDALRMGWSTVDCYLNNPDRILESMTGKPWRVYKTTATYLPLANELEILRYERKTTAGVISHFVCGDGRGGVAYDPYGDSRTVREGTLVSKRIFQSGG